ncbi:MAG: pyridoxamine 5'-phosphate oxidase [Bdellovibrionaceae bacterium]|nr:pyridoxamine 5'-phosphate oxidase [Pseudobdellovibrionaceae bacterium]
MGFIFSKEPHENFLELLKAAEEARVPEPTAMALATQGVKGPDVRIVLFKGFVRGGLSFYTNYSSQKAQDLENNPQAAVSFFWPSLAQQIRIFGVVEKLTREESEVYFRTRPRLSQLGAWASKQSRRVASIEELNRRLEEVTARFAGAEVPCPPYWGGYRLEPDKYEFWFGREGRLHERYCYQRVPGGGWERFMKMP